MSATKQNYLVENTILHGDCVETLHRAAQAAQGEGFVDLIFADPPFNIGYTYDKYDDNLAYEHYVEWTERWMKACSEVLAADGTFWVAIGDEYAAEIRITARKLGLEMRNWVIWYYTFGQCTKKKFARSHTHLFYFIKNPKSYTFNDMTIRVPSARQTDYNDRRANAAGKIPDDTWILRPREYAELFTADQDVWDFSRVCGTFKERQGFHGCQMPEKLLERIILSCSNEGDLVLDPFSGSGTTVATAAQLGRRYIGLDLSENYVQEGLKRLERLKAEGQSLFDGAAS